MTKHSLYKDLKDGRSVLIKKGTIIKFNDGDTDVTTKDQIVTKSSRGIYYIEGRQHRGDRGIPISLPYPKLSNAYMWDFN